MNWNLICLAAKRWPLLFSLVVLPVALLLARLVTGGRPEPGALTIESVAPLLVMTLVMTLYYLGEELGWRGYLQVQAAPGRPLLAAALTGLIWGLWHYPLILVGFPGYEDKWALLIHPINSVFISIFMGWLRERSQSVWPACLAHAVDNSIASGLLSMMLPGVSALVAWGGYGMAGYAALSLLVLLLGPFRTSASLEPAEGHPMTGSYQARTDRARDPVVPAGAAQGERGVHVASTRV